MGKFYNEPGFLAERDAWYKKLEEEGFDDIEIIDKQTGQPGPMLRGMSPGDLQRGLYKPETEEYFRCARAHVWRVRRGMRRQIWKMHAEGFSEKKIWEQLEGRYEGITFYRVREVVKTERAKMGRIWDRMADDDFLDQ